MWDRLAEPASKVLEAVHVYVERVLKDLVAVEFKDHPRVAKLIKQKARGGIKSAGLHSFCACHLAGGFAFYMKSTPYVYECW